MDWNYFFNIKPKGFENKTFENLKEDSKKVMKTNLTLKSVLLLVFITVCKTILDLFLDSTLSQTIIDVLTKILNSIFGVGVAGALWGIRRRLYD